MSDHDQEADVNDAKPTAVPTDTSVDRFEVVDEHGRAYTRYRGVRVQLSYQDGGRTLKVFVEPR